MPVMKVQAIKTPVIEIGANLPQMITECLPTIEERSVIVIASKIFSYAENRIVKKTSDSKDEKWNLAKKEADWWLDPNDSKYQCMLTIKGNWMFANAGIDESNANGDSFALWPKDPQQSLNQIWLFLRDQYHLREVGVIMSDSRAIPFNWGVTGHAIAYCGFEPLYSYVGKPDIFGRLMKMEQINVAQSLVVVGTYMMGEGDEQTPLAVITGLEKVKFQDHVPTQTELAALKINLEDDIFAPIIKSAPWHQGGKP